MMKIQDIGGEFALIERLAKMSPGRDANLIQGIGDDAAVIEVAPDPVPYWLVTTDMLVAGQHFKKSWAEPHHIGFKASECNISDIAAMGGMPHWMFVSLALDEDVEVAWVEGLYEGLGKSCRRYGISIAGGDTTHGSVSTVSITLIGSASRENLCLRSQARPGDILMVTGTLGASAAALASLNGGNQPSEYLMQKHLTPCCRLDISDRIAPVANAMIDISDGLASEVHHICSRSGVGAQIQASAIPIHADTRAAAKKLGIDAIELALGGGEDFELLFSIRPEKMDTLAKCGVTAFEVGRITDQTDAQLLMKSDGSSIPLGGGFDHFHKPL